MRAFLSSRRSQLIPIMLADNTLQEPNVAELITIIVIHNQISSKLQYVLLLGKKLREF